MSVLATNAVAHPGGVDAAGGHVDKRTGLYHFHRVGGADGDPIDMVTDLPKNAAPLKSTTATPEQKRKAAREHAAESLLQAAHQSKRHVDALSAVAQVFPDTKAGARARRAVIRLSKSKASDNDPKLKFSDEQLAEQAAALRLRVAKQLFALKQDALAIEVLTTLVKEHPQTHAAKQANKLLDPKWPPEKVPLPEGGFFEAAAP